MHYPPFSIVVGVPAFLNDRNTKTKTINKVTTNGKLTIPVYPNAKAKTRIKANANINCMQIKIFKDVAKGI